MKEKSDKRIFDNREVSSGRVIARLAHDDSRMYTGNNDPCDYLSDSHEWVSIECAKFFPNEEALAEALEIVGTGEHFPLFIQTTITTITSPTFNEHLRRRKIVNSLGKLNSDDIATLGINVKLL